MDYEPKVICSVRDVREVLCSFEKLWRNTKNTRQISQEMANPIEFQTMRGRMEVLSRAGQVVGASYQTIVDACTRGFRKNMHFVEYDLLTTKPKATLDTIYSFLELPTFKHDFDNVEQVTQENDLEYVWRDLHKIRSKVAPQEPTYPILMSQEMIEHYTPDAFFWRKL